MKEHERRYSGRVSTDFPAAVSSAAGSRYLRVLDLSRGGARLQRGRAAIRRGDRIAIQFRLPTGAGPIHCEADVMHQGHDRLGVRFTSLTATQQEILGRYLDRELGAAWYR